MMDSFHIIKERDIADKCPYCGNNIDLSEFESNFDCEFHYKTFDCGCGKKLSKKVDFIGDGTDNHFKKENIDKKIERAEKEEK